MSQCALSGEIARQPVVNTKSGHIYERSLILKHLEHAGTDPVTGTDSCMDDLIDVKMSNPIVRPRAGPTSLPSLVSSMQDEWDALMLETYSLRSQLHTTRKELSHALYQYDAACRVIARLTEERDQARSLLSAAPATGVGGVNVADDGMQVDDAPIEREDSVTPSPADEALDELIRAKAAKLSSTRKDTFKSPSDQLAHSDSVASYTELTHHTLHLSTKPGIMCVDAHQAIPELIATGGVDTRVILFNTDTHKVASTLKGHTKSVRCVAFHATDSLLASGADDHTIKLWAPSSAQSKAFKEKASIDACTDSVTSLSMHVTGSYLGATSADESWSLIDLDKQHVVRRYANSSVSSAMNCGAFHPDGILFAGGHHDSSIHIWDSLQRQPVKAFELHHTSVTSVSFCENGYYLASGDISGKVHIWDLRKLKSALQIDVDGAISCVRFNSTGHYLGVAASKISVFKTDKRMPLLTTLDVSRESAPTSIVFAANASYIASVSLDRRLVLFGSANK